MATDSSKIWQETNQKRSVFIKGVSVWWHCLEEISNSPVQPRETTLCMSSPSEMELQYMAWRNWRTTDSSKRCKKTVHTWPSAICVQTYFIGKSRGLYFTVEPLPSDDHGAVRPGMNLRWVGNQKCIGLRNAFVC